MTMYGKCRILALRCVPAEFNHRLCSDIQEFPKFSNGLGVRVKLAYPWSEIEPMSSSVRGGDPAHGSQSRQLQDDVKPSDFSIVGIE